MSTSARIALTLALLCPTGLYAEMTYVIDQLFVGVHQDRALDSPIIKVLPSGTPLEVLARDGEFAWVQMEDGSAGWVDVSYLMVEKPASLVLSEQSARFTNAQSESGDLRAQLSESQVELRETQSELANVQAMLANERASIANVRTTTAELQTELSNAKTDTANVRADLAESQTALENTRAELETVRAELVNVRGALNNAINASDGVKTELANIQGRTATEVTELKEQLRQAQSQSSQQRSEFQREIEQEAARARTRIAELEEQLRQAQQRIANTSTKTTDSKPKPAPGWALNTSSGGDDALATLKQENETLTVENDQLRDVVVQLEQQEESRRASEREGMLNATNVTWRPPHFDETSILDQYTRVLDWEGWQKLLLFSSLLLAFGVGGYVVDYSTRKRHGGFRI